VSALSEDRLKRRTPFPKGFFLKIDIEKAEKSRRKKPWTGAFTTRVAIPGPIQALTQKQRLTGKTARNHARFKIGIFS
jgi:hypothetical protein